MFNIGYQGFRLIPSKSAGRELLKYGLSVDDCREILERGYEPRKRGKGTVERWMDSGDMTYNVVIVKSYNFLYKEDVYLIKHVGRFRKSRRIKK